jgi:hypothetical protein
MAIVVNDTEVVFSQGCRSQQKAESAIVSYLCKHENFGVSDFNEACFAIGENDLRMDLMVFKMQVKDFETVQLNRGILIEPPPSEKDAYRVVYAIDILAATPLKAAKAAHRIMTDPESMSPVLEVMDPKGKVTQVDLSQQQ